MKSIWNGTLSFGLVAIPVQLYSVAQEHLLGFKMLCDACNRPLHLKRWCERCKKEVTWEHVVKGIEIKKGEYFVVTKELIKSLKPTKSTSIAIESFIEMDRIDPVYFNTHYYVAPTSTEKAYTLFQYALGSTNKVAIGSFVMRDREQVCMIQSYHHGLLLTTLYYEYEIKPVANISILQEKQPPISSPELKLAKDLIASMTVKKFAMSTYKDNFAQELKKLIQQKKKGKVVKTAAAEKTVRKKGKKQPSLMEVLKASLQEDRKHAQK